MSIKYLDDKSVYLVYINNEICGFVKSEESVKKIIEDIAQGIEKSEKTDKPEKKYFQQRGDDFVNIFAYRPGMLWNGKMKQISSVSYKKIPKVVFDIMHIFEEFQVEKPVVEENEHKYSELDDDDNESYESSTDTSEWSSDDDSDLSDSDSEYETEMIHTSRLPFLPPPPKFLRYMLEHPNDKF